MQEEEILLPVSIVLGLVTSVDAAGPKQRSVAIGGLAERPPSHRSVSGQFDRPKCQDKTTQLLLFHGLFHILLAPNPIPNPSH